MTDQIFTEEELAFITKFRKEYDSFEGLPNFICKKHHLICLEAILVDLITMYKRVVAKYPDCQVLIETLQDITKLFSIMTYKIVVTRCTCKCSFK